MDTESLHSRFSSIVPRVEFCDVQDQYSYNDHLPCKYCLIDYEVQEGDRIAIFKLGWQYVKDYVLFEWVPKDSEENDNVITFNKYSLPKATIEIYQFAYISGENVVHGASEPFQFCDRSSRIIMSLNHNQSHSYANEKYVTAESNHELLKLKDENQTLKEALKVVLAQNKSGKTYDNDISELYKLTRELRENLYLQQNEIKDLKNMIRESGEEYKKLYLEKAKAEKKYEKLKLKYKSEVSSQRSEYSEISESDLFDFEKLESLPPFPFAK